jgi:diguanylate cyclase (GGDEF)-like protein
VLAEEEHRRLEIVQYKKDGKKMYLEVNASLVEYNHQPAILSIRRDITTRKLNEEKLRFSALHDALTNLPNRTLFLNRLNHALSTKKRNPDFKFSVIFLDLDNFKNINDVFGHSAGDKYIQALSVLLKKTLRDTDMVSRFGGDEFVILIEGYEDQPSSLQVCNRIQDVLTRPITINNNRYSSTASIGIVNGNSNYSSAEEIIRDADIAMYKAKDQGGNIIETFDDRMRENFLRQIKLEEDLEFALERKEFSLFYQPIISLHDGSIFGLEALLRWKKPDGRMIPPSEFIPIIEKTGLINKIGEWVLNEAIDKMLEWKSRIKSNKNLTLSVNISAKQLEHLRFSDNLLKRLKSSKLDTGSLSIEVTESTIIQNIETTYDVLDTLQQHGMQIFLDDFGTGYSSLNYLANLPISILKIDRVFISNVTKTLRLNLLTSMINLGHELGMKVVAEGIETRGQLNMLRKMGCDFGQGYYLQRPADAETISKLLARGKITV